MPIRIRCPNPKCPFAKSVADTLAGKNVKCPQCGTPFVVPAGSRTASSAGDQELAALLGDAVKELDQRATGPRPAPPGGAALCNDCGEVYNPANGPCPMCFPDGLTVPRVTTRRERAMRRRMIRVAVWAGGACLGLLVLLIIVRSAGAKSRSAIREGRAVYAQARADESNGRHDEAITNYQRAINTLMPAGGRAEALRAEISGRLESCRQGQVDALVLTARKALAAHEFDRARTLAGETRDRALKLGAHSPQTTAKIDALIADIRAERGAYARAEAEAMRAKGMVRFEDRWMTEAERERLLQKRFAEAQKARGLVLFDGDWLPPEGVEQRREQIRRFTVPQPTSLQREWVQEWTRQIGVALSAAPVRGDDVWEGYFDVRLRLTNASRYPARLAGDVLLYDLDTAGTWRATVMSVSDASAVPTPTAFLPKTGPAGHVRFAVDVNRFWRDGRLEMKAMAPIREKLAMGRRWQALHVVIPRLEVGRGRRRLAFLVLANASWERGAWVMRDVQFLPWNAVVLQRTVRDRSQGAMARRLACFLLTSVGDAGSRRYLTRVAEAEGEPAGVRQAARLALEKLPEK